jgi:hypothetical protein
MPATVTVRRWTGSAGAPTKTDVTSATTRLSQSDSPTPGTSNPIPIPTAGESRSWWAHFRLSADTTPAGTIDNLKWYSDGANGFGTGVTMQGADASTGADAGYREATDDSDLTQANHTGLDAAEVDVFTLTSGSPRTLGGSISNPSTGDFGDFFVQQFTVISTASPGATPAETFTFQYDET